PRGLGRVARHELDHLVAPLHPDVDVAAPAVAHAARLAGQLATLDHHFHLLHHAATCGGALAFSGCLRSSGETKARLPLPSTSDQPSMVLRSWWWEQRRSMSSRRVMWLSDHSRRWSFCRRATGEQPSAAQVG